MLGFFNDINHNKSFFLSLTLDFTCITLIFKAIKTVFFIAFQIITINFCWSQIDFRKNNIQINGATGLLAGGGFIAFEHVSSQYRHSILLKLEAGGASNSFGLASLQIGWLSSVNKNNHFELLGGGGITLDHNGKLSDWAPLISGGYRFQKPKGRFIFRTGIGFPFVFIGFGFAF